MRLIKPIFVLMTAIITTACASSPHVTESNFDPQAFYDKQFSWGPEAQKAKRCEQSGQANYPILYCKLIMRKLESARMTAPNLQAMSRSLLSIYNAMQLSEKSRALADQLISMDSTAHEVYVIRAEIALKDGDERLAKQVLQKAEYLVDELGPIYETFAAVDYYNGNYKSAEKQLTKAFKLGSDQWRISYHQGVIAEAKNRWQEACSAYQDSLMSEPMYRPSQKRLRRLQLSHNCL